MKVAFEIACLLLVLLCLAIGVFVSESIHPGSVSRLGVAAVLLAMAVQSALRFYAYFTRGTKRRAADYLNLGLILEDAISGASGRRKRWIVAIVVLFGTAIFLAWLSLIIDALR